MKFFLERNNWIDSVMIVYFVSVAFGRSIYEFE